MKILTFSTDEAYKLQAEGLKASAETFGLECVLIERPDLGKWHLNANAKCEVIHDAINTYGDEPIVWNDADCRYVQKPALFDEIGHYDMAAVFLNANSHPFGGTLWLNGKRALPYVEKWMANVRKYPDHEDDAINFRMALHLGRPKHIYHLPPAYCWRERDFISAYPRANPVIIHTTDGGHTYPVTQISREDEVTLYG